MDATTNRFAPPESAVRDASADGAWDGRYLRVKRDGRLPPICLKCAAREDLRDATMNLRWVSPWAYLSLLIGPLVLMIVYVVMVKRGRFTWSRCGACARKQQRWGLAMAASAALFVALLVARASFEIGGDSPVLPIAMVSCVVAFLVAAAMRGAAVTVRKVEGDLFWLAPKRAVRQALETAAITDDMARAASRWSA